MLRGTLDHASKDCKLGLGCGCGKVEGRNNPNINGAGKLADEGWGGREGYPNRVRIRVRVAEKGTRIGLG